MNRKQRVLTILALVAFVVIGALHYVQWPRIVLFQHEAIPYTEWEETTWAEVKWKGTTDGYPEHPEIYFKDVTERHQRALAKQLGGDEVILPTPPDDAKAWLPREKWWWGKPIWSPQLRLALAGRYDMAIADVRLPWFMLGVIYAGLFFLVADRKEKQR